MRKRQLDIDEAFALLGWDLLAEEWAFRWRRGLRSGYLLL